MSETPCDRSLPRYLLTASRILSTLLLLSHAGPCYMAVTYGYMDKCTTSQDLDVPKNTAG